MSTKYKSAQMLCDKSIVSTAEDVREGNIEGERGYQEKKQKTAGNKTKKRFGMFCLLLKSQNETTEVLYEFHTIGLGQLAKLRSFEVRIPKVKLRSFKESPHGKHVAQSAAINFYVFSHIFVEIAI